MLNTQTEVDTQTDDRAEGFARSWAQLLSQEYWNANSNGHVWERDAHNQVVIHPGSVHTGGCQHVRCSVCEEQFCVLCMRFEQEEGPETRPCRGYYLPAK